MPISKEYDPTPFWAKVDIKRPDECWFWKGATDKDGYGKHYAEGKTHRAHCLSYELRHGERPRKNAQGERLVILHTCDERACVNPHHLRLGTQKENIRDRDRKGRQASGVDNGRSKLTERKVVLAHRLIKIGITQRQVAKWYGVHHSTIGDIIRGKLWPHLKVN